MVTLGATPGVVDLAFVNGDDASWTFTFTTPPAGSTSTSTLLYGHGVPPAGLGNNGDFYTDLDSKLGYGPKSAGAWGSGVSVVINYSTFTFVAQMRLRTTDLTPAATFTVDATASNVGVVKLSLTGAVTKPLTQSYVWNLQATSAGSLVSTLLGGKVTPYPDATR